MRKPGEMIIAARLQVKAARFAICRLKILLHVNGVRSEDALPNDVCHVNADYRDSVIDYVSNHSPPYLRSDERADESKVRFRSPSL